MSVYLRLVIGPIVVCDIDLFATVHKPDPDKDPPPQLAGGSGTLTYPDPVPNVTPTLGFAPAADASLSSRISGSGGQCEAHAGQGEP